MSGELHQKTISKTYPINIPAVIDVMILVVLGILAITLRAKLKTPIGIPGCHGIEVMAIFLTGRYISRIKPASSITGLAAALMTFLPFMGFNDPFLPGIYIIMGLSIDVLFQAFKNQKYQTVFIALTGALAYVIIPLSRLVIVFFIHYPYGSFLKYGFMTPVLTHLIFGLTGGFVGAGLTYLIRKSSLLNK